jgi:hypothetical protein
MNDKVIFNPTFTSGFKKKKKKKLWLSQELFLAPNCDRLFCKSYWKASGDVLEQATLKARKLGSAPKPHFSREERCLFEMFAIKDRMDYGGLQPDSKRDVQTSQPTTPRIYWLFVWVFAWIQSFIDNVYYSN